MTILVGVQCSDGIVIGADSVATSAAGPSPLINIQSINKIHISRNIIIASTGAVGLGRRLIHHVEQAISGGVFTNLNVVDCTTNISKRFLSDAQNSLLQKHPQFELNSGALVAASIKGVPCLVEYSSVDFQPEIKKDKMFFVSMGSGQLLADPFLAFVSRVLWGGNPPTIEDAKFGVYWALSHTIKLAPGGVGEPIRIATLQHRGGQWIAEEVPDAQEQAQFIEEMESHINGFVRGSGGDVTSETPPTLTP